MFRIIESQFITSAVKPADYPPSLLPEIAFSGKSNVGKSSLLNSLLKRKKIAKVSSTPGKTRLINFFEVSFKNDKTEENGKLNFVDLPGYGYAKVSKTERENWKKMVLDYFRNRETLRGIIILIDIRHRADPKDKMMIEMLSENDFPFIIVATKSDKIPKTKIPKYLKALKKELEIGEMIAVSSLNKTGLENILNWIEKLIL